MPRFVDKTGMRFGYQTVQERAENHRISNRTTIVQWLCCCDCGNKIVVRANNQTSGNTRSCGCKSFEMSRDTRRIDITGQKFGLLVVIGRAQDIIWSNPRWKRSHTRHYWLCQCDCGNTVTVWQDKLLVGDTQSCGCIRTSAGEAQVKRELIDLDIDFQTEKTFSDLLSNKGRHLRFDFALYDKDGKLVGLIEYQGEQHYKEYKRRPDFGKQQREVTDQMKRDYCAERNIPLYEIRYDDDIPTSVRNILEELNLIHADPVPSPETGRCNDYGESQYPDGETPAEEVPCPQ